MPMTKKKMASADYLRERAVFVYIDALEDGDLETMLEVLRQAEEDPVLEQMILEIDACYMAEMPELELESDAEKVRELLARYLPSATRPEELHEPAPLTVSDVANKLRLDNRVPQEDREALARLRERDTPLPAKLGLRQVGQMAAQLGINASERFWRLFRDTALLLGLTNSKQHAGFAAARRQRGKKGEDQ